MSNSLGVNVLALLWLVAVVLLVLWVVLPFAVFGIKSRLQQLLEEQRRTNALLQRFAPPERKPPHE